MAGLVIVSFLFFISCNENWAGVVAVFYFGCVGFVRSFCISMSYICFIGLFFFVSRLVF